MFAKPTRIFLCVLLSTALFQEMVLGFEIPADNETVIQNFSKEVYLGFFVFCFGAFPSSKFCGLKIFYCPFDAELTQFH